MAILPDFSRRSPQPELMDDLSIQGPELSGTLDELALINRTLGGYGPSLTGIARLLPPGTRDFTLLDVGTGAADTPRRIVDWFARRGVRAHVLGIDLSATTVDYARSRCAGYPTVEIARRDLFALDEARPFDVVHAALVLHHFPGEAAARALSKMFALSRHGVVVNDLHRHPLAWAGIRLLTAALSQNRLIRADGPLSVLRAFSRRELVELARDAAIPAPELAWRPLFRWRALFRRSA